MKDEYDQPEQSVAPSRRKRDRDDLEREVKVLTAKVKTLEDMMKEMVEVVRKLSAETQTLVGKKGGPGAADESMPMRTLYVYVPNRDVSSIIKHGLLGARSLYKMNPNLFDVSKYKNQFENACRLNNDLVTRVQYLSPKEKILEYLDWRVDVPNGSDAIYALFYPVPDEAKQFMAEFLADRTLLAIETRATVYNIGGELTNYSQYKYLWSREMAQNNPARLWFEGVPHCYFICAPSEMKLTVVQK